MKQHFVETSNHHRFMAGVTAVENRGSPEACIQLLTGSPGTGKSVTVDNWGARRDAIYLEGIPGMSLTFIRDYLADQTNVYARGKFEQFSQPLQFDNVAWSWLRSTWQPAWRSNLRGSPFVFGWDTVNYPSELYLVNAGDHYSTPHQQGGLASLTFDVTGVAA